MVWILGAYYFLLFAYLGAMMPWFPPLLEERGFDERLIGLALLAVQLPRAFLPPAWGWAADRLASARSILIATSLLAGLASVALAFSAPIWVVFVLLLVHGFFLVPLFPLAETLTFEALGDRSERYGRVRLWGSVGFIVAALGLGELVDLVGMSLIPWVTGSFLVIGGLLAFAIPTRPASARPARRIASEPFPWRRFAPLLVAVMLGQASHGAYYAFFSIQLSRQGYSALTIGFLWALGVVAEIALLGVSSRPLSRLGLRGALLWALGLASLRWLATSTQPPLALLAIVQLLHAASFALLHVASVQLADRLSPPGRKALGQSLISAFGYGLGLGVGTALAGAFATALGFSGLYLASAGAAIVGYFAARWVRE